LDALHNVYDRLLASEMGSAAKSGQREDVSLMNGNICDAHSHLGTPLMQAVPSEDQIVAK